MNDPITMLNAGECVVGTGPASTSTITAERGNPIGLVEGRPVCRARRRSVSKCGAPFHGVVAKSQLRRCMLRLVAGAGATDAAPRPGIKPINEINTFTVSAAQIAMDFARRDRAVVRHIR